MRLLASCSLPPCGGGLGWGVNAQQKTAPPPQPSPTRGEGVRGHRAKPHFFRTLLGRRTWNGLETVSQGGRPRFSTKQVRLDYLDIFAPPQALIEPDSLLRLRRAHR